MSESGLKAIFLERRRTIERLLRARTRSVEEAEDALQELWLRIDQMKPGPITDPVAYLLRTAMNLVTDRSISARRRRDREGAWLAIQPGSTEFPDQEAALAASDELMRLQEFLHRMPVHMAQALRMFRLEGMTQRAIAAELGMSVSGVEKLLARAYRLLAEYQTQISTEEVAQTSGMISRSTNDAR